MAKKSKAAYRIKSHTHDDAGQPLPEFNPGTGALDFECPYELISDTETPMHTQPPMAPTLEDLTRLIGTMQRHKMALERGIQAIVHELQRRALVHDASKWAMDEIQGFVRINAGARLHPYGSEAYQTVMRSEKATIERHYANNDHHPEHHAVPAQMHLFQVIEMAVDWYAAWAVYDADRKPEDRTSLAENLAKQRARFGGQLSPEQWWLIEQVTQFLGAMSGPFEPVR